MSKTWQRTVFAFALVGGLLGQRLYAVKIAVGPATCQPSLAHYSKIQDAVNGAPVDATIYVCPGTYAEQVVIKQPLILQGVTDGTGNSAVIAIPSGGLKVNAPTNFYGGTAATQLLVESVGVTISDLTIDGTGVGCVSGTYYVFGIEFYNVGTIADGTAAGRVENNVVRNLKTGCLESHGIVSDNSDITISGNEIHDTDFSGIYTSTFVYPSGTINAITNNSVQRPGWYGITSYSYAYPGVSTITGNTVSDATQGGMLIGSNAVVSKNTIMNTPGVGLWLFDGFGAIVTQNTVSNAQWPLEIEFSCCNTVQNNRLSGASADGIRDENSFGANNITKNTVNEGAFGIFTDASANSDTYVPNTIFNAVVTVDPGTAGSPGTPTTPTPPPPHP
jgi:Right handed beta helix region